jgi:tetratricopeptide (TPR) repeat protein
MSSGTPSPAAAPVAVSRLPQWKRQMGMGLSALVLGGGGLAWWVSLPEPPVPEDQFAMALELLDRERPLDARELAKELEGKQYMPDAFPGGVDYVLGMAAFQLAERDPDSSDGRSQYLTSVEYLRETERRAIDAKWRPRWAFALGKSLFRLGELTQAYPLLLEALDQYSERRSFTAGLLAELALEPSLRTTELLTNGLTWNQTVLSASQGDPKAYAEALLQRADLQLALRQSAEAETTLQRLITEVPAATDLASGSLSDAMTVLRGRIAAEQGHYHAALSTLETIASDERLGRVYPRYACFLMGQYAEALEGQLRAADNGTDRTIKAAEIAQAHQRAIDSYTRTINRFERTEEGLAAYLQLGRILQSDAADEKALQCYGSVLRSIKSVDEFRNRWLSVEQTRQMILAAWTSWTDGNHFEHALALAELMTPLFTRDQAYEVAARTQQRWAESLERELSNTTMSRRAALQEPLQHRWRESGAAYERLSVLRRSSSDYTDALWISSDHYRRGQDFNKSLAQLDRFLDEPMEAMRPVAGVRRAELLLDLDRLPEAVTELEAVIQQFPNSPAVFPAQYLLGKAYLEQDNTAAAEQNWRGLLRSPELTPSANEWRSALQSLGQLVCEQATWEHRQLDQPARRAASPNAAAEPTAAMRWTKVAQLATEATRLNEEYVTRYPTSSALPEARYYLSKSLQLQAKVWQRELDIAETENARQQNRQNLRQTLERALSQLTWLRDALSALEQQDRLDVGQRQILESAWFELPQVLFALKRYDDAILGFSTAVNRYPSDVRTLTAYLQMAQSYARLGREIESRSMLEQAKVILNQQQLSETAFAAPTTNLTKAEWENWLDWASQLQR